MDPRGYWRSPLNVLSAFVLLLSSSLHDSERVSEAPDLHLRPAGLQAPALHRRRAGGLMTRSSPSRLHFCHRCFVFQEYTAGIWRGLKKASLMYSLIFLIVLVSRWLVTRFWKPKRRRFRTLGRPRHSPVHALQTARSKMSDYSDALLHLSGTGKSGWVPNRAERLIAFAIISRYEKTRFFNSRGCDYTLYII